MDLAALVASYQANLYSFLYRMTGDPHTAEDLLQETFVRALRAGKTYEPRGRLSSWLFSIAANLAKDHFRRNKNRCFVPLDEAYARASGESTADEVLDKSEVFRLRRALLDLPVEQRAPLIMFYYHDMSYEDIAKCLVIPVGTVRSRIHNGKTKVRQLLEGGQLQDDGTRPG